ncbi:GCN5-related N-acetyltransferase 10, chloroplastic [Raphanus sativus]|uniref:GCN5-related N-acetyltransferase 10, chloroplastic n=1 Tax=Raphanus sativus TaxID=3726 RepID=A0A6J0K856_RAPSA|nr:GCN5-related N-acetyltransferase 10, chloroplastic [Raphanus sativus]
MAHLPHSLYSAARPKFPYAGKSAQPKWSRFPGTLRCASTESLTSLTQNAAEIELKYMVSQHGWGVRRLRRDDEEEIRRVSLVQAEAFHIPLALFNDFFFLFFQAEVLSGLLYKLKNSPPDRYACLVAEQTSETDTSSSSSVVGVVDITVQTENAVLRHFPGVEEYLYVSGLAVSKAQRRKKMASTLLKACDVICYLWGFKLLALRAYEDDAAARNLYSNAGYTVVESDPPWTSTWIGRKRRVLMTKRIS